MLKISMEMQKFKMIKFYTLKFTLLYNTPFHLSELCYKTKKKCSISIFQYFFAFDLEFDIDLEIVTICKCIAKKFKIHYKNSLNRWIKISNTIMATFKMKMEKNHFKKNIDLFFLLF